MRFNMKSMDEMMGTHFVLKLFFMFLTIIMIVVALNFMIAFEAQYLGSEAAAAIQQIFGVLTYILTVFVFMYIFIWIIYTLFRRNLELKQNGGEDDEY